MFIQHIGQSLISEMPHQVPFKTLLSSHGFNSGIMKMLLSTSRRPVLTLYTKHPCPLCDDAKEILKPFQNMFILEEVDITEPGNKEWFKKYCYDIPVFHFEGEFLMKHNVDLKAFKTALRNYQNSSS